MSKFILYPLSFLIFLSIPLRAQTNDSTGLKRHTLAFNLFPTLLRNEINFTYERKTSRRASVEVMMGYRIPQQGSDYYPINLVYVGFFTVKTKKYESNFPISAYFASSINHKFYFSNKPEIGLHWFLSIGAFHRYSYFNRKCIAFLGTSETGNNSESNSQDSEASLYSIRKFEPGVSYSMGLRKDIALNKAKNSLSIEASAGLTITAKMGKRIVYRELKGYGDTPFEKLLEDQTGEVLRTEKLNGATVFLPFRFKIGYSWGK